ncbi:hypothetical protein KNP414_01701 [Paenibacillus mucilaginosus KNP414]|uniref:Uncharacterized protein n=1 Tax=Paenibacillus mucilaginosus (strain KNP414) TaxID=1036673 RepID=F8FQ43_PAEMK|nr:hypothetical protein KNP414_01701 [Paenibacillus mucilaginosus KNP414]
MRFIGSLSLHHTVDALQYATRSDSGVLQILVNTLNDEGSTHQNITISSDYG